MNSILPKIGIILCLSSSFVFVVEGVLCYQCAYIVGVADVNLNPNCVNNVWYSNIFIEEGIACMKAEGIIGGQYFVLRRAVRGGIQGAAAPYFPLAAQESLGCESFGNVGGVGAGQVGINPLAALTIGNRQVDTLTSCLLCNDQDECNGAEVTKTGFFLMLTTSLALFLCNRYILN